MRPEELLAIRVLNRHKLRPPFDLQSLVEYYGDIELCSFPIDADGVTVNVGADRPSVLINKSMAKVRRRFTLAHELGHIIIPWHTGTFVSHLEADDEYEYGIMEGEANRFAAELLMPTAWLLHKYEDYGSAEIVGFISGVMQDAGVSKDAALIKIFSVIRDPIICVRAEKKKIMNIYKTESAPYPPFIMGSYFEEFEGFSSPCQEFNFAIGNHHYYCWCFEPVSIDEVDSRPWRELLNIILTDVESQELLPSVNATMAAAFQKFKIFDKDKICAGVLRSFESKGRLKRVASHSLFAQYVVKRVNELSSKQK